MAGIVVSDVCIGVVCWSGMVMGPAGKIIPVEECPNRCGFDQGCGSQLDCVEVGLNPTMCAILGILVLLVVFAIYVIIKVHCFAASQERKRSHEMPLLSDVESKFCDDMMT